MWTFFLFVLADFYPRIRSLSEGITVVGGLRSYFEFALDREALVSFVRRGAMACN